MKLWETRLLLVVVTRSLLISGRREIIIKRTVDKKPWQQLLWELKGTGVSVTVS